MTVTSVIKDAEARTMTIVAHFDAPIALTELTGGGTRMHITTAWDSIEAMEQMLAMGMGTGMTAAVDQTDALLSLPT